jgi:hypothetical protein
MAEQIDRERDNTGIQQWRQQQPEDHLRIGAQRRQWYRQQRGGETAGENDRRWWQTREPSHRQQQAQRDDDTRDELDFRQWSASALRESTAGNATPPGLFLTSARCYPRSGELDTARQPQADQGSLQAH